MIRLGYVSLNTQLESPSRTFRIANYSEELMLDVVGKNLVALEKVIDWNVENKIFLFRITSDLIPYGSSLINTGAWKINFVDIFQRIGDKIKKSGMRTSMHPGQYTVLNSITPAFYQNALNDLDYHASVLDLLRLDNSHKIILHGGYGRNDKKTATISLIDRINKLPSKIRNRLALENDDRIYNAKEILDICNEVECPAIFDVLHHQTLPSLDTLGLREVVLLFKKTWPKNLRQKIHYSEQKQNSRAGAHAESINTEIFKTFYNEICDLELDIMLEVKDKEKSVLKLRRNFPHLK